MLTPYEVPEQTASDWLKGEDNLPLPISLDPSRRGTWETQVDNLSKERQNATPSKESADKPVSTTVSEAQSSKPENVPFAPSASAVPSAPSTSQKTEPKPTANPNLPSLHDDEDYSSTGYQARVIADYLVDQVTKHKSMGNKGPLMVGLQGPQGCGE